MTSSTGQFIPVRSAAIALLSVFAVSPVSLANTPRGGNGINCGSEIAPSHGRGGQARPRSANITLNRQGQPVLNAEVQARVTARLTELMQSLQGQGNLSQAIAAILNAPLPSDRLAQWGTNLELRVDGQLVSAGARVLQSSANAADITNYLIGKSQPSSVAVFSNGKMVFLINIATQGNQTSFRHQAIGQPGSIQTVTVPTTQPSGAAIAVLSSILAAGSANQASQGAATLLADLPSLGDVSTLGLSASKLAQLLMTMQGLAAEGDSGAKLQTLITAYNDLVDPSNPSVMQLLLTNPAFQSINALLQELSTTAIATP